LEAVQEPLTIKG